jgi:Big-like domain-containing protein
MLRPFTSLFQKQSSRQRSRSRARFRPAVEFLEGRTVPATHFVMDLTTATAGVASTVHVTAVNANGTTDANYLGMIEFRSSDPRAVLPVSHQRLYSGTGSFDVTFLTAGTDTLLVQDMDISSITGESSITVSTGPVAQFGVVGFVSSPTAGTAGLVTVTAQDLFGNRVTDYSGTVHFTSSDTQAVLPGDSTLTNGQKTFNVTFKTAGTQTLATTDAATATITGELRGIAQNLAVYTQPPDPLGGQDKSSWFPPDGMDGDQYIWDRFVVDSSTTINEIQWRGAYPSGGSSVADFTISIYANSPYPINEPNVLSQPIVSYHVGGNAGETLAGTFGGVAMYDYQFTLPAAFQAVAGTSYWVQIEASQAYPNDWSLAYGTGGDGSHFREVIGGGGGGNIFQIISHDTAFTLYSTSNAAGVVVSPGPTAQFIVSGFASPVLAGTPGSISVTAEDAFGNLTPDYTGTVHFTSSDAAAVLPGDSTLTSGTGTFDATLHTGGLQSITVSESLNNAVAGSQSGIAVHQAPGITNADHTVFVVGGSNNFQFSTSGYPAPILGAVGPLPDGVSFTDNGNGTATLAGIPALGTVGNFLFTVTAHNDAGSDATQSFALTVAKAATSIALVSDPGPSVFGQPVTFTATVHPSVPGITSGGGTVTFYDGTTLLGTGTVTGETARFTTSTLSRGIHSITAAYDGDANLLGSTSSAVSQKVKTVALVADPRNPARKDLMIGGTDGNDLITVTGGPLLTVEVRQKSGGTFHLLASYSPSTVAQVILYGGAGNDVLKINGATPPAILFGGAGDDKLRAGTARSMLIGGAGADQLFAGNANTVLIGGITDYDGDVAALAALRAEWARTDLGYQSRVGHLLGPVAGGTAGGKNGQFYLNPTTVHDDATPDVLTGGTGLDWYFPDQLGLDSVVQRKPNEVVTMI